MAKGLYKKRLVSRIGILVAFFVVSFSAKSQYYTLVDSVLHYKTALDSCQNQIQKSQLDSQLVEHVKSLMRHRKFNRLNLDTLNSALAIQQIDKPYFGLISWSTVFTDKGRDSVVYHSHMVHRKFGSHKLYNLVASSDYIPNSQEQFNMEDWYGAIYYQAIPYGKRRDGRFLLFGWKQGKDLVQCKFIESIELKPEAVAFGSPKALIHIVPKSREVLEYPLRMRLNLKYEYFEDRIYFDDFESENASFYDLSPTFRFNGYTLAKNERWVFKSDMRVFGK